VKLDGVLWQINYSINEKHFEFDKCGLSHNLVLLIYHTASHVIIPQHPTLHYTTLHYTTLHYTTLHYTALHYTTLHYTTLHYTTLHYTTLHYTTLHYTTLHYTTLHSSSSLTHLTNEFAEWRNEPNHSQPSTG
jgi:hypothetical protein